MTKSDINKTGIIRLLPRTLQKYAILSRIDRPIGYLLLWIPIIWGALASRVITGNSVEDIAYICVVTFIGSIVMRGAGCTWNDIADRNYDKKVARTASRPIASGQVSIKSAFVFLTLQLLIGLWVLLSLTFYAQVAGLLALIPAILYPFMKRFTYWPQAWLGITFNWGIWVGWLSFTTERLYVPLLMHIACIFWTLGYDTIYAHQDRDDDLIAGVKSSALKLGDDTKPALWIFYGLFCVINIFVAYLQDYHGFFYMLYEAVILSFAYQIVRLDINNPTMCLRIFKHNFITGAFVTIALWGGALSY